MLEVISGKFIAFSFQFCSHFTIGTPDVKVFVGGKDLIARFPHFIEKDIKVLCLRLLEGIDVISCVFYRSLGLKRRCVRRKKRKRQSNKDISNEKHDRIDDQRQNDP